MSPESRIKVYVANIASDEGETAGFSLRDHLDAVARHTGTLPFDVVLANSPAAAPAVVRSFRESGAKPVTYDPREFEGNGFPVRFVEADVGSHESPVRHDPGKLARSLMALLAEERDRA